MVEKILLAIVMNGAFLFVFLLIHYSFSGMIINVGSKKLKRARKKHKGFWQKLLCLDFKHKIVKWHYSLFIVFLASSLILLILLNLAAFADFIIPKGLWLILVCVFFCSYLIVAMSISHRPRL